MKVGQDYARDAFPSHREALDLFRPESPAIRLRTEVREVLSDGVVVRGADGEQQTVPADTVFHAVGFRPDRTAVDALAGAHPLARVVGDALRPATVLQATRDAMFAAYDVI